MVAGRWWRVEDMSFSAHCAINVKHHAWAYFTFTLGGDVGRTLTGDKSPARYSGPPSTA